MKIEYIFINTKILNYYANWAILREKEECPHVYPLSIEQKLYADIFHTFRLSSESMSCNTFYGKN
jgi:hypothetical protein